VRREGGAHVLGGSGEGEDLPVRLEAPGARWGGVEVVKAGEGLCADEIANSACTPGPPSLGLNGWFSSFVGESPPAAAPAQKSLLQLFRYSGRRSFVAAAGVGGGEPAGALSPRGSSSVRGCLYPRGRNRSLVCNDTLSAGVLFIAAVGA
jgi:hypothetical protein